MSNSVLVDYTKITPNSDARKDSIRKITIHHMGGNLSVETCGNVFQSREASTNYGISSDGNIGLYVDESRRAWSTANPTNDHQAINIEVANDGGAPDWHVSDVAIERLIDLCVDICQRNGITRMNYTGGTDGNLTRHNMFMATTCPGPYLQGKFLYIADEINKRLGNAAQPEQSAEPTESETIHMDLPLLQRGDKSPLVHAIMVLMAERGYYEGPCDDLFGPRMESGVRQMQADHNLGVDGEIGNNSYHFLLGV